MGKSLGLDFDIIQRRMLKYIFICIMICFCKCYDWKIWSSIRISAVSESRLSNPSPSHHLRVRVRVKKKIRVRVTNLVVHIFNICLSSKTWKQTTKCIECQSKQHNTARPLLLGLGRDSGPSHESRFLSPSPSQSEKNWTRFRVWVKWTRVPTRVTQHWLEYS